jgi:hypothetical protein
MEKTTESTRERGKRFLDELKEKGPDLSMVGKTVVKLTPIHDELDEPLSDSRKLMKLRYDIVKERDELENIIKNKRKLKHTNFFGFISIIERILFKYKFEKTLNQIKKDEKVLEQGVFRVSQIEIKKSIERKKENINWIYSKRELIKQHYSNEFIMKLVRKLGFVDSLDWYN